MIWFQNKFAVILILITLCYNTFSQQTDSFIYTGKLIDSYSGANIKDANVTIKERDFIGRSNFLGYFQAVGAPGQRIQISHIYYEPSKLELPFATRDFLIRLKPKSHHIGTLRLLEPTTFDYDESDFYVQTHIRENQKNDQLISELNAYFPGGNQQFISFLSTKCELDSEAALLLHDETVYFSIEETGKASFDSLSIDNTNLIKALSSTINNSPTWLPASQWGQAVKVSAKVQFKLDAFVSNLSSLDSDAGYVGGYSTLVKDIDSRIEYPFDALMKLKTGKVVLEFSINAIGQVTEFVPIVDPGFGMTKELIRVLKSLDNYSPAILDGIPVTSRVRFAYKFQPDKNEVEEITLDEIVISTDSLNDPAADVPEIHIDYSSFEEVFEVNPGIVNLSITNQGLDSIPASISALSEVRTLDLSSNNLSVLPAELFQLGKLKGIYLSNNLIEDIPQEIRNLELLEFTIANNKLTAFPFGILNCEKLRVLDISGNQIQQIPGDLMSLRKLKSIYLNDLPISELPDELMMMKKLRTIYVRNTFIPEDQLKQYQLRFPDKDFIY